MLGTTTTAAMASVALFRGGQFRSSSSSSAPHYSLVAAAATPISPAAAEVATTERRNNDGVIVHGRGRHESSRRRLRRLQNTTTTSPRVAVVVANVCKSSPTLHPGESISRGEFLCHGDLRFGIDARDGRFIVGFAANANAADVASTNATIAAAAAIDDGSAPSSSSMFDGASDAQGIPVADAAPVIQAWAAIPTTLFTAASTSFSLLKLSAHGNLLGYSSSGAEIYDSNYDYYNRLSGKRDDSVLGFNPRCAEEGAVRAMASGGREMCVTLTSPARAGMPYGMVTWGVAVDVENFVEMYPVEPTPSPVVVASPTSRPNMGRPAASTARMPSASPSRAGPAGTAEESNNLFLADASPQNNNDNVESPMAAAEVVANAEPASIIWGTVWIDSNRNGAIDQGESTANGFEVRLYECSSSENAARNTEGGEGEGGGGGSNNLATKERVATTDGEGMYFFNVPAGRTYRIKFDLDNAAPSYSDDVGAAAQKNEGYDDHKFGYTHGEHTSANMLGWTDCETSSVLDPIQWNAGLYVVDDAAYGEGYAPTTTEAAAIDGTIAAEGAFDDAGGQKSPAVAATSIAPVGASIGGHIYLDVDEDGSMDSKERTAAVGGYTVNDAVVVVSLADCRTNEVLATSDVMFPGTYEFGNLTEGLYRLGYRMQLRAGHGGAAVPSAAGREDRNAAAATITPSPPYSFVDGTADDDPTAYETGCGKLGKGEAIDSGNVGLRPARPLEITAYVAGGPLGPQGAASDGTDDANATVPDEARAADVEAEDANEGGSGGSTVPVLVGVLVTLSVVAFAAALFVKQRNGEGGMFPFLGGSSKTDGEVVRSVGSVAGLDDDDDDASSVASAGDTGRTAIGSLVVEAGNMSVAALTNITGGKDDDDDDSDSDDSSSSSSDEENRSYTGMEFALQNRQQQQQQQQGTPNNNNLTMDHSSGGGGSPYQYSLGSDNNSPSHVREVAAREGGSEGYEVYDNVNDGEHGNGVNAAVYGSVISNMIANYSQAQEGHGGGGDEDERRGLIEQGGDQGVQAQNYSDLQGRQEGRGDYHGSAATAAHPQEHLHGYSEHQDQHANYGQDRTDNYPREQQSQNYYSVGNNAAAYDQVHQHQYAVNGRAGELQYEEMSTTSGSSARSSDPPAASYRDIPAANSGWDGRGGHPHHPAEEHHEHHHQAGEHHHQYSASHQYVPGDGGAYAANYEGYDSNQYAAGNDGSYPANYDSSQYAAKEEGGAYAPNYDDYDEQHQPVDSDSSESLSELMSDDESESSEEASASGWSSSSETTGGASLASKNSWSYFPTSGGSKSLKAAARRAQSNPRDDRRIGGWRNEAAIPENSTVEYNAYAGPDGGRLGDLDGSGGGGGHGVHPNDNVGTGGYTPVQPQAQAAVACDDKSVVSAGSAGSEGSADPPGASYKKLSRRFPPPPRTSPPPRRTSPNPNASSSHNRVSPNTSPHARRTSPHTSPVFVRGPSPNNTATASRRGRSVPPPPPPRGYPSPPPR